MKSNVCIGSTYCFSQGTTRVLPPTQNMANFQQ